MRLPALRKKIIYLDQFFFSHAFRAGDQRFMDAAERISRLTALQLLVAPYSSIHEDETHQWNRHDDLLKFIKAASRGEEFEPAYDVERTQLVRAFRSWLGGSPATFQIERKDAIANDVDSWDSYFRIDVGRYIGDIDLLRDLKRRSIEGLVDLFPGWRELDTTFDDDLQAEYAAAGKGYMDFFLQFMARIANNDYSALFDAPIASTIVETFLTLLPDEVPPERRLRTCGEFLVSEHFKSTPLQALHARMLATLKAIVKEGAYRNRERALQRLSGFFFDVKHIATYAPYVDAFLMDQPMADLVSRQTVNLEGNYAVRVFSLNNWDELFTWLDAIENAGMTEEHRRGLEAAYPGLV